MGLLNDIGLIIDGLFNRGYQLDKEDKERIASEKRIEKYNEKEEIAKAQTQKINQKYEQLRKENDADDAMRRALHSKKEASKRFSEQKKRRSEMHPNPLTSFIHNYAQSKAPKKKFTSGY